MAPWLTRTDNSYFPFVSAEMGSYFSLSGFCSSAKPWAALVWVWEGGRPRVLPSVQTLRSFITESEREKQRGFQQPLRAQPGQRKWFECVILIRLKWRSLHSCRSKLRCLLLWLLLSPGLLSNLSLAHVRFIVYFSICNWFKMFGFIVEITGTTWGICSRFVTFTVETWAFHPSQSNYNSSLFSFALFSGSHVLHVTAKCHYCGPGALQSSTDWMIGDSVPSLVSPLEQDLKPLTAPDAVSSVWWLATW